MWDGLRLGGDVGECTSPEIDVPRDLSRYPMLDAETSNLLQTIVDRGT